MTDGRFEKKYRLLGVSDFSGLKIGSLSFKKPSLIVYYKKNLFEQTRIGLSIPKKIGKAYQRNRLKRVIRELFRQSPYKTLGYDVLFIVSWSRSIIDNPDELKEKQLLKNIEDFFVYIRNQVGSIG